MTSPVSLPPALQALTQNLVGRPLEDDEIRQLLPYLPGLGAPPAGTPTSDLTAMLNDIRASSDKALAMRQQEEQAILRMIDGAHSLSELRPSALPAQGLSSSPSTMVMTQIADRLANLARQEVQSCFEQYFGPLKQELTAILEHLQAEQNTPEASGAGEPPEETPANSSQGPSRDVPADTRPVS